MRPKAISVALMRSIKHGVLAVALAFPMLVSAQVPKSGAEIAAAVSSATVGIQAQRPDGSRMAGSGFIVDPAGTVVTNLHVVEGASFVEVRLSTDEVYPVTGVKAVDQRRDLAVLQVGGFKLPTVTMGDSSAVRPGDRIMVIGNALGMLDNSVTAGIVSGIRDAGGYRLIQMDAAISRGNSGGPVVNERGEVVGVATLKLRDGDSLNFAVPVNYARGLLALPVTAGLNLLAQRESSERTASDENDDTPAESTGAQQRIPEYWKSTSTGNIKRLTFSGNRVFVENAVPAPLRDAGAVSVAELRRSGDRWVGVHRERVNCRPMPFVPRKVCPVIEMPMTITSLSQDRIEGVGEEPLNGSAFDCRRCSFIEKGSAKPFIWLPQ